MTAIGLDQIIALCASVGLSGAGIGYVVKQGATALTKRSEAKTKRIAAEADARVKDAETERLTAEAGKLRAESDRTESDAIAAMLSRYETRLTEAEAEAREARATIVRMQSRLDAQAAEIAALHRAVRRLGGTPTGLHAAATKPGAKE